MIIISLLLGLHVFANADQVQAVSARHLLAAHEIFATHEALRRAGLPADQVEIPGRASSKPSRKAWPATLSKTPLVSPLNWFDLSGREASLNRCSLRPDCWQDAVVSLMAYLYENVITFTPDDIKQVAEPYNRTWHFGRWVNDDDEADCYDTRNEVLMRDALPGARLVFKSSNPCVISRGHWRDPYTDNEYKLASAVQVDHVVPLKNAYYTGGFAWPFWRRCHYANFLGNGFHLRTVSGHENMSKADRAPDAYMPPHESFHCQYLHEWMKVKIIWMLAVTIEEIQAIEWLLAARQCSPSATQMRLGDLLEQRELTEQPTEKCLVWEERRNQAQQVPQ